MKVDMTVNTKSFSRMIALAEKATQQIQVDAFKYFRSITPIRSGNARRRTRLSGDTIVGDYPYGARLDQGWSNQAPDGMTQPTVDYIEKTLIPQAVRRINRGQ
jgi:hypothetical protein